MKRTFGYLSGQRTCGSGDPVIPGWSEGPDPESRDSGFDASHRPGMTAPKSYAVRNLKHSQLSCIRERKRRHAPRVLIQDQRARDRRLGALAAVFALAEPAVDPDRRGFSFLRVPAGSIDQFGGLADFAPRA